MTACTVCKLRAHQSYHNDLVRFVILKTVSLEFLHFLSFWRVSTFQYSGTIKAMVMAQVCMFLPKLKKLLELKLENDLVNRNDFSFLFKLTAQ